MCPDARWAPAFARSRTYSLDLRRSSPVPRIHWVRLLTIPLSLSVSGDLAHAMAGDAVPRRLRAPCRLWNALGR